MNARLKSEKPVTLYLDLNKLMTTKTSIFMFKKDHSTKPLLQRRKINTNVPFIKNFSATNRTVEKRKKLCLISKSLNGETHFRNVLNHSSSITDQIDDHDRTRPQANRASMSEYHMNEMCINEQDRSMSKEEVRQSVRSLKHGKAPGLDNMW